MANLGFSKSLFTVNIWGWQLALDLTGTVEQISIPLARVFNLSLKKGVVPFEWGSPVDIIYLDFQKAFDKVPHQRLLLKSHGIWDGLIDWIEHWLTDRSHRVVVDGEVSNWKSVLSGLSQGSVLGPLLFLIYISDLDNNITSNVLKFADDTEVFRKVNTDGDKKHLQNDLDRLVKWSEKWQMLFNFGKCKCLHIGHGNLNVNYKIGDTVLGTTVKEKDLGVTISTDMKVSEQCGIAASKSNQILGVD